MHFIKMHSIGNDYVYINGFIESVVDPSALSVRIANRHTGIGGDGLILILPPDPGVDAHIRMRIFNADGSEAEMCGNGIRCVCKLAYDYNIISGIRNANPMRIQTSNAVLSMIYTIDASGKVDQVTVDMGEPILTPAKIPVNILALTRIVNYPVWTFIPWPTAPANWIDACGLDQRMTCVSMGNPHVVFFCKNVAVIPLEQVGPIIEYHPVFPRRINVHFVQVHSPSEVTMRTWERGSGVTMACGTGAAAVVVAGVLTDNTDRTILAHLPGGELNLQWSDVSNHVFMTGPATEVFTGDWPD